MMKQEARFSAEIHFPVESDRQDLERALITAFANGIIHPIPVPDEVMEMMIMMKE